MSSDEMNNEEPIAADVLEGPIVNTSPSLTMNPSVPSVEIPSSMLESKPRLWTVFVTTLSAALLSQGVSLASAAILGIGFFATMSGEDLSKLSQDEVVKLVSAYVFAHPALVFFLFIPGQIALLGIAIFAAIRSPVPFVSRLSLTRPSWPWWVTVAAVLAAPFVTHLWSILLSGFVDSNQFMEMFVKMSRSMTDGFGIGVSLLCFAALPAFSEEWLFRGYVQTRLAQRWSPWLAILVSSLLFAVFHGDPVHVIFVFPIGLWLGYISWRSGSIIPAMLAHAYNNSLSLIGAVYDQTDALDTGMAAFSDQLVVFLGLPGLLVFIGYRIASRKGLWKTGHA